ncbi:OprD family porin [Pseudomonas sp. LRF_L74]|uniref:OprD family porin n=1 Tax=Pseudomonas sp. LRF_L74 TaxID=3369422 RepID=UPI003F631FE0
MMKYSVGVLGLVLAQGTHAAGFIDDSHATLLLRNFYSNVDNRDGAADPNYTQEWGQGAVLNYTSGFTEGPVGFGIDAVGMYGLRLDSGKGHHYNPTSTASNGNIFPTDSDGRAVHDFASFGPTAKARIGKTEFRYGTLQPKLPVLVASDRLVFQTFRGFQVESKDIESLTLTAGNIDRVKERGSTDWEKLSIAGSNATVDPVNPTVNTTRSTHSNQFLYGGGSYKVNADLTLQYYFANLKDFYDQHFLGGVYGVNVGPGRLTADVRYYNNSSDGKNANDVEYYSTGYYGGGRTRGEVDSRLSSMQLTYALSGHSFSAGYQQVDGDSDAVWVNEGAGTTSYFFTETMSAKFQRAGERTWILRYGYDFTQLGAPGLTFRGAYYTGDNIKTANGDAGEWARDLTLGYVVQSGPAKGLNTLVRYGILRSGMQRDTDEYRVIIDYPIDLF